MVNTPGVRPEPREVTRGMPYADAVAFFGLKSIRRLAKSPQRRWNWENREGYVPWEYLGPALLTRAQGVPEPAAPACALRFCACPLHQGDEEATVLSPDLLRETWAMIGKAWKYQADDPETFRRVHDVVEALTKTIPDTKRQRGTLRRRKPSGETTTTRLDRDG